MSWQAIARKDFQDAVRSYWLIGLTVLFMLVVSVFAAGTTYVFGAALSKQATSTDVLHALNWFIAGFVPLIALILSLASVSGERESGSLKLLLALPHSREDVVFGKFAGRAAAISTAIAVGFVLPGIVLALLISFEPLQYLGYILFVVLLAVVFTAIGVGISANTKSQWRSTALGLAFYFVFITIWVVLQIVTGVIFMLILGKAWPEWMPLTIQQTQQVLRVINPSGAFKVLSGAFMSGNLFAGTVTRGVPDLRMQVASLLMLVFWMAAPLALGLYRFEEADL